MILFSIYSVCFPLLLQDWPTNVKVISFLLYFWHVQAGQRIVMFSYGSGLTSTMFSFKINEGQHPFSLLNIANIMDVSKKLKARHVVSISDILSWKNLQLSLKPTVFNIKWGYVPCRFPQRNLSRHWNWWSTAMGRKILWPVKIQVCYLQVHIISRTLTPCTEGSMTWKVTVSPLQSPTATDLSSARSCNKLNNRGRCPKYSECS